MVMSKGLVDCGGQDELGMDREEGNSGMCLLD